MKIEKEFLEDHQVKLRVEFEPEQFNQFKRRAAKKLAKKVKIPGFRPGKAPYNVIVRHVGEGAILEDATEILVNEMYPKVLEESEIDPYGPGNLNDVETLEPPTLVFTVPLAPEVELGDYKTLEIPYEPPVVTDEDIDEQLEQKQQELALTETSTEAAKVGDRVYFQISAERVEPEEGQDAIIIPERFNSTLITENGQDEWPFPGFSDNLIGMSAEETKDILYTYPEDSEDENLSGVEAVFHVQVTNIQTITLPDLDDEFAKSASDFDTLEELRADILQSLSKEKQIEYDNEYNNQVLDAIVEQSTVKYPPQMLDDEIREMISDLEYRLSQQNMSMDLYKQIRGIGDDEIKAETRPYAETRLTRGLVLAEIAKAEELKADEDQLAAEFGRMIEIITRNMSPKEIKKFQQSAYTTSLVGSIYIDMITSKTLAYLRAIAKGDPLPDEAENGEEDETDDAPEAVETAPEAEAEPAPEDGDPEAEPEADPAPETDQPDEEEA